MLIEKYIDKEFVTIQPEFDIFKILDIFDGCDYSSVPVVENGKYLGLALANVACVVDPVTNVSQAVINIFGKFAIIPAMIINEIPFPTPF